MKLYVYDHCPFCVRARMIFGLKNLPVELVVLANDDEATPIGLVGKKVVPILVKEDGTAMPESLAVSRSRRSPPRRRGGAAANGEVLDAAGGPGLAVPPASQPRPGSLLGGQATRPRRKDTLSPPKGTARLAISSRPRNSAHSGW